MVNLRLGAIFLVGLDFVHLEMIVFRYFLAAWIFDEFVFDRMLDQYVEVFLVKGVFPLTGFAYEVFLRVSRNF